jgi:hypothetical protein
MKAKPILDGKLLNLVQKAIDNSKKKNHYGFSIDLPIPTNKAEYEDATNAMEYFKSSGYKVKWGYPDPNPEKVIRVMISWK